MPVVISNTSSVLAQSGTILYVSPAASDIILNNARTINLSVTNGVNVNAFDVIITYDPALLTLSSWSHGGYLSNLANVLVTNNPGSLRVVATQLARPGVSGDGILLNLVFRGVANGISPITITKCEFAYPEGGIYHPTRVNGMVTVQSAKTTPLTPTLTTTSPTFTATTPSITPEFTETSPTFEPTPTASADPDELLTITATEASPTPPDATTIIDTSTVIVTDGNSEAESSQPGDKQIEQTGTNETDDQLDLLNKFLWGTLVLSVIILVAMITIAIRRKNTEHLKER